MRLTVLALTLLPVAAQAQSTTQPAPTVPLAQSQSCPVGMTFDAAAGTCTMATDEVATPLKNGSGCNYSAHREVMS